MATACASGYARCGGQCVPQDLTHCGDTCQVCPAPPSDSVATCAGTCGFTCNPGRLKCGGACCLATGVHASGFHACALTVGGGASCWGYEAFGGLGDGVAYAQRNVPVNVLGVTGGITALASDVDSTCALTSSGAVKCWGSNSYGQLGDGTNTNRLSPVDVVGLGSGVTAISGHEWHFCALTSGGGVKCWGYNYNGQLGDGTSVDRNAPVDVVGLSSGVVAVSVGKGFSCAAMSSGGVKCWGNNAYGQLGDGTSTLRLTPVDVPGLTSITSVRAGRTSTCALSSSGGLKCWGDNGSGQLGDGTTTSRRSPVDVSGLTSGVVAFTSPQSFTCAVTSAGGAKCWGTNHAGQLGDGTTTFRSTPVDVFGLTSGAIDIATGYSHSCALTSSGAVLCWGYNGYGQLGDGTYTSRSSPALVSGK